MKKIILIAAHPDDELLGSAGTLLSYKAKGYQIKIIFLSDGESSRNISEKKKNPFDKKKENTSHKGIKIV